MSWGALGQWRTLSGNRVAPVLNVSPLSATIDIDEPVPLPVVTANDDIDGDVSYKVITSGTINSAYGGVGKYQYSVSDIEGNTATAVYTVYIGPQDVLPGLIRHPIKRIIRKPIRSLIR